MRIDRETYKKIIEKLEEIKLKKIFVIVEGKKDKKALLELGLTNILVLNGSVYEFCENIAKNHKEIIILTDLDTEGKKLYSKIKENLEKNHVKVKNNLRELLLKSELSHIQGLNNYLTNLFEIFEKKYIPTKIKTKNKA